MSVKPNQLSSPYNCEMRRYPWTGGGHTHFHSGIARHLIEHTLCFSLHFFLIFFFTWLSLSIFRVCIQISWCFWLPRVLSSEDPFFTLNPLIFRCSFPCFPQSRLFRIILRFVALIWIWLQNKSNPYWCWKWFPHEWKNRCFLLEHSSFVHSFSFVSTFMRLWITWNQSKINAFISSSIKQPKQMK